MKATWFTTLLVLVIGLASFTVVAQMSHEGHGSEHKGSEMKGSEHKETECEECKTSGEMCEACKLKHAEHEGSEMMGSMHKEMVCEECKTSGEMCEACKLKHAAAAQVRCALDGMKMKASAMVPMKYGEGTMYFCNDAHHEMFMKAPERYLKTVRIGEHEAMMHVLTVKEYKGMMESMGMGKMAKVKNPNATHYLSVHFAEEVPVEIAGIVVKVVAADGKVSFHELAHDKMMKSHTGSISLLNAGKHKVSLLFASSEVEM